MKLIKAIWENEWMPADLFRTIISTEWREYDSPDISLFGTSYGYFWDNIERTIVGKFVDNLPAILSLLIFIIYYPVVSILWIIIHSILSIIKGILSLFTKKWKDV